jgi:hypothetical protein
LQTNCDRRLQGQVQAIVFGCGSIVGLGGSAIHSYLLSLWRNGGNVVSHHLKLLHWVAVGGLATLGSSGGHSIFA